MKKEAVSRLYKFSDANLVITTKEKIAFMYRDIATLVPFGITITQLKHLEAETNAFLNTVTDIEAVNNQKEVSANKSAKAEQLRGAIRVVMLRVELLYGSKSATYKKFGTTAISRQKNSDLLITSRRVVRVANEFLTALATTGLTAEMLNEIAFIGDEFETLLIDHKIKMGDRDIMQENRVEAGNTIYKTLVKYTTIGLNIWANSNVAKCNDYVLYSTANG